MCNTFNDGLGEQYGKHSLSYWRNTVNSSDSGICPKDYVPELPTVTVQLPLLTKTVVILPKRA